MSQTIEIKPEREHELVLCRVLEAPRENVYRAWTEPSLFRDWFCPKPWTVSDSKMEFKAGGVFNTTMKGPEGQEFPNEGIFLEVIPGRKLVFTDALKAGFIPQKAFMVATITLEDEGPGRTRYTARVDHWSEEDKKKHEQMGFHQGWGAAIDQLEQIAQSL